MMASQKLISIGRVLPRIAERSRFVSQNSYVFRNYVSSSRSAPKSSSRLLLKGVALGAVVGTCYAGWNLYTDSSVNDHKVHEKQGPIIIDNPPVVKVTRRIVNPKDDSGLELVLFQYQTCPFCCKVRSFLDYSGLSYSVVEVDAVLRQSIKWSPSKKVPILLVRTPNGKFVQLNDSSMIISTLASFLLDKKQDFIELASFYPSLSYIDDKGYKKSDIMNKYFLMFQNSKLQKSSKEQIDDERKWRAWADETLVHLISPNVYRTKEEALETFEWFAEIGEWNDNFPSWERNLMVYVGAAAMYGISKRLKKRHNLTDDVRSHMYDACDLLTNELEKRKSAFLGGKKPNLGDLAAFGVLSSMEGCATFKDCLENTKIGSWFYAMKMNVSQNRGETIRS